MTTQAPAYRTLPRRAMGSELEVRAGQDCITIILRVPASDIARVASAIFGCFFLTLWAVAWVGGTIALFSGHQPLPMVCWLLFWTLAGILLGRMVWLLFQPARAEAIVLKQDRLSYDPGTSPVEDSYTFGYQWSNLRTMADARKGFYEELFTKRQPIERSRAEIDAFSLEDGKRRKRLIMRVGEQSVEIGAGLWDPDREWLYKVLSDWHKPDSAT